MIPQEFSVEGKAAIVTGAGRGIGRAIATTLAEAGADVAVISRTRAQIEETAHAIEKLGRKALALRLDVSREEQVEQGVEQVVAAFGRVDILCSNAGIFLTRPVAVSPDELIPGADLAGDEASKPIRLEDWRKVLDTNLTAALLFARAVGPHMIRQRKGKVVITSSTAGEEGQNFLSAYCVSKAAIVQMARSITADYARVGIRINTVCPGDVDTPMLDVLAREQGLEPAEVRERSRQRSPDRRLATVEDIAAAALFLASDEARHIHGVALPVEGGGLAV